MLSDDFFDLIGGEFDRKTITIDQVMNALACSSGPRLRQANRLKSLLVDVRSFRGINHLNQWGVKSKNWVCIPKLGGFMQKMNRFQQTVIFWVSKVRRSVSAGFCVS